MEAHASIMHADRLTQLLMIIHPTVLGDTGLTVQQIAKSIGITSGYFHSALTETLGMSKMSSIQQVQRVDIFRTLLARYQADLENFCRILET